MHLQMRCCTVEVASVGPLVLSDNAFTDRLVFRDSFPSSKSERAQCRHYRL